MGVWEDRYFVRLDPPCHGADSVLLSDDFVDHFGRYDDDARWLALAPLRTFVIYKGPDGGSEDRWFPAAEGLETVRGLLKHYRRLIESGPATIYSRRERWDERLGHKIAPLEILESLLSGSNVGGAKFFIAHRDHCYRE